MYDLSAVALEVHAFTHDLTADQDVREERCVESAHEAQSGVALRCAGRDLNVPDGDDGFLPVLVVRLHFVASTRIPLVLASSVASR